MIKIPSDNRTISIPNNSDLFGNIHYTKNINLDEEGYITLSPRAISVHSQDITSNIHLPLAFGRKNDASSIVPEIEFAMTQSSSKEYWVILSEELINFNLDSDGSAPTLVDGTHGKWFHNSWHVTDDDDLFYKDDNAIADVTPYVEVTDGTPANLTAGKVHALEVFRNRDTLCVTNGNQVLQYSESGGTYTASTTLTLPSDFEAIGLSYSNYRMGVITMPSDTASGQNQDAYFFVWNGSDTSAEQGIPIGSDKAIAITSYKGSWVILTRTGQLLFYTGGGFKEIAAFPFYFKKQIWGDSYTRDLMGDVMIVEGDNIYINVNGIVSPNGKRYEISDPTFPAGVWCYDPKIGLYNRYTPSIARAGVLEVPQANVNTTTNLFTINNDSSYIMTVPSTGSPIKYIHDKANQIGGLDTPKIYYCIKESSTTFKLAETKELAEAGVSIDLTSTGATNNYFLALEVYDYGATIATKSGAMGLFDTNSSVYEHMIFGAELNDHSSTADYNHINILSNDFENRGYFVTPKIPAQGMEDNMQGVFLKYRPLDTGDSIKVKMKTKEIVGLPVSTPQALSSAKNQCVWTGANSFYTTADFSIAKTAFDNGEELECEVIAGAGAGNLVKISNIQESGGTYVITLDENVIGAAGSRYCDVRIDNWTELETIDSTHPVEWKWVAIGETSSWFKFKIELRGANTSIEQATFINKIDIPSIA